MNDANAADLINAMKGLTASIGALVETNQALIEAVVVDDRSQDIEPDQSNKPYLRTLDDPPLA